MSYKHCRDGRLCNASQGYETVCSGQYVQDRLWRQDTRGDTKGGVGIARNLGVVDV